LTSALKLCYAQLASNTMPKKTKKAKLIAQYRRKLQQLEGTPVQSTVHTITEPKSLTSTNYVLPKELSKQPVITTAITLPAYEFVEIKKDLIKTLIIVCLFLGIEFIVWKIVG
jgi:hypothetical protein